MGVPYVYGSDDDLGLVTHLKLKLWGDSYLTTKHVNSPVKDRHYWILQTKSSSVLSFIQIQGVHIMVSMHVI